ncbi:MAG: hypothetical protein QXR03_03010 [Candidatus Aenigmatarchaeota archaeon]
MVDLQSGSIILGYAFAGLGYLLGLLLLSAPFTSKSMKIKGNEMMEYSIVCSLYLSLSYIIYGLFKSGSDNPLNVYNIISSFLGGNLIGGGSLQGVANYYFEQWGYQLAGFFGCLAIPLGASFVPLVGAAISYVFLTALFPFLLLFTLTTSLYFTVSMIFYIFDYLAPILFFLGSALIPAPLKIGRKIGGLLVATSLVFTALGPAIPTIANIISKGAFQKAQEALIKEMENWFLNIVLPLPTRIMLGVNPINPTDLIITPLKTIFLFFLQLPYAFALGTVIAMLFLAVSIEGLSEAIGGAGEKIIEV